MKKKILTNKRITKNLIIEQKVGEIQPGILPFRKICLSISSNFSANRSHFPDVISKRNNNYLQVH